MRLGVLVSGDGTDVEGQIGQVRTAAGLGFDSAYFSQLTSWDAIQLAALSAREVPGIDVGTSVTQTYPRHPLVLAGQALTAQAVSRNRFTLGIGPSHPSIIEDQFGQSYDQPARHVREHLAALGPLLRGERVDYHGETLTAVGQVDVPGTTPPPVLLAALGPVMLRIAGELTDGTVTVWTGPRTIGEYIAPTLTRAANAAGRPDPRVVAIALVSVTADPDRTRQRAVEGLGAAGQLPSYRRILDRQNLSGVDETVVAGDENTVARAVRAYADAGTTDLVVGAFGDERERTRTLEVVAGLRAHA